MRAITRVADRLERAVFLDKDGTLVENAPFNVDPARIRLAKGAEATLAGLQAAGYRLVVVSNQSGVARGYFPETALIAVEYQLRRLLRPAGVTLDGFYYCPHLPDAPVARYRQKCRCRKPGPGLLLQAGEDIGIDLWQSWMVGDILDDVEAGRCAGCRTVLLDRGHESEWKLTPDRSPDLIADDLTEAARLILAAPPPSSRFPARSFLATAEHCHE